MGDSELAEARESFHPARLLYWRWVGAAFCGALLVALTGSLVVNHDFKSDSGLPYFMAVLVVTTISLLILGIAQGLILGRTFRVSSVECTVITAFSLIIANPVIVAPVEFAGWFLMAFGAFVNGMGISNLLRNRARNSHNYLPIAFAAQLIPIFYTFFSVSPFSLLYPFFTTAELFGRTHLLVSILNGAWSLLLGSAFTALVLVYFLQHQQRRAIQPAQTTASEAP